MSEFSDQDSIYFFLIFIVPGLITLYFRSQFITGRMQTHSDAIFSYITLSMIYGAFALPFLEWMEAAALQGFKWNFLWFSLTFIGPAIFGISLGIIVRTEIFRRLLRAVKINPVHCVPTAWDWKFGNMSEHLLIVTLKDETKFAGYCGKGSFMSSDPTERDIFIEKIYKWGDDDSWKDVGEHGLWVAPGEIRSIEFFPVTENGESNV
jgi:hypothetical protein